MYLSKVSEFNKILLNSSSSIGDAIKSLNRSGLKIVIILSKKKILGTIVDGDIRRGLLKGLSLKDRVTKIMRKNSLTVSASASDKEAKYLMNSNEIQHIPVINKKKK